MRPPSPRSSLLLLFGGVLVACLASAAAAAVPASRFEAQASLIPKLREFYGGMGGYRALIPILILTIGPLKIIPAFVKLTAHADPPLRRRMAWRASLIATAVLIVLALSGWKLLINYNIPLTAILFSGGLVLVLVALRMVLAQYGDEDDRPDPPPAEPSMAQVVQPLVFPTILTPYGIAVVITMSALVRQLEGTPFWLMGLLVAVMAVNLLAMLFARPILRVIQPRFLQLLGLVLSVIQLALGFSMIFTSIEIQALVLRQILS
ncbi:MarC family protein [Synechococcus sp. RedBA-s]|uniref:MarC family protein n=1 Tax=Synechococcus sp. RedBA-s TaxID=2823741 RepID=UPI0020CD36B9|nr:MarC family protein [Synechococcus sp. RedBA-s]MCP9800189.1 MarC family protein [Synechococcus sp. RedBA-s]